MRCRGPCLEYENSHDINWIQGDGVTQSRRVDKAGLDPYLGQLARLARTVCKDRVVMNNRINSVEIGSDRGDCGERENSGARWTLHRYWFVRQRRGKEVHHRQYAHPANAERYESKRCKRCTML